MFEKIAKPKPAVEAIDLPIIVFNNDEASLEFFLDSMQKMDALEGEFRALEDMSDTIENLHNLKNSIKTHGLTKSLVSFADSDLMLSTAISSFPSLESLTGDKVDEAATKAALEGIIDTIKETVVKWAKSAWASVQKAAASALTGMGGWMTKFKELAGRIKGKVFNAEKAKGIAAKAGTLTAEGFKAVLGYLKEIPAMIKSVWEATGEKRNAAAAKLKAFIVKMQGNAKGAEAGAESIDPALEGFYVSSKNLKMAAAAGKYILDALSSAIPAVLSACGSFFKSIPAMIKAGLSAITSGSGEAARVGRKVSAEALSATWAAVKAMITRVRELYSTASTVASAAEASA